MSLLEVKNLSKVYGSKILCSALNKINLDVEKGEFVGIMGPSGSGKTTLLNLISTIDKPTSGEVLIEEKNPYKLSKENLALFRRRELGFVFQNFNLLNSLTVEENIMLPLTLEGVRVKEIKSKTYEISKMLNITDILNKRVYEISGGQAQRVAISRAIIHNPKLLLADEPTGSLDSKSSRNVMNTFCDINKNIGTTIFMVTHDPFAASFCNRVIFIKDGELYNEIYKGENRKEFYDDILSVLSFLGGDRSDFS